MVNQCLHIVFSIEKNKNFVHDVLQKSARMLGLEGVAHEGFSKPNGVKVVVCGQKDVLEKLIDVLHQAATKNQISQIEIEPIMKEKDFRGVFRVIE